MPYTLALLLSVAALAQTPSHDAPGGNSAAATTPAVAPCTLKVSGLGATETRVVEGTRATLDGYLAQLPEIINVGPGRFTASATYRNERLTLGLTEDDYQPQVEARRVLSTLPGPNLAMNLARIDRIASMLTLWRASLSGASRVDAPALRAAVLEADAFVELRRPARAQSLVFPLAWGSAGGLTLAGSMLLVSKAGTVSIPEYGGRAQTIGGAGYVLALPSGPDGKPTAAAKVLAFLDWTSATGAE